MEIRGKYSPEEVDYLFGGVNQLNEKQRCVLARVLSILDKGVVDKVSEEVFIISSNTHSWGWHLPLNSKVLKQKKSIIFLSEELFKQKEKFIEKTILHEIAHHILNHKSLFDFEPKKLNQADIQEKEADKLVEEWLNAKC